MAIQLRRGNEADLDISRLKSGELAVCLDSGKIIVKLTGNNYLTLADVSEIPDVSGFITSAVSNLANYYDKSTIDTALSGKQNALTAGSNITIATVNGVLTISATGGGESYSDATQQTHGLMSTADKIKLDGINISVMTQSEYEALDPPDADTVYLILEETT